MCTYIKAYASAVGPQYRLVVVHVYMFTSSHHIANRGGGGSVQKSCTSVAGAGLGTLQCPGTLQEQYGVGIRCFAASWIDAGALQRLDLARCSVRERCRSIAEAGLDPLQLFGACVAIADALQELDRVRCSFWERWSAPIVCIAASRTVAGVPWRGSNLRRG